VTRPGDTGSAPALAQLAPILAAGGPELAELALRTEERLAEVVTSFGAVLGRHAGTTLSAGGKRLRPMLLFLCAGRTSDRRPVAAAVAVELLHMATLVHDDVLDGAALRRGRPTVYRSGGRAAATATGDLLFSRAFAELARMGSSEAVRVLSRASSGLARGELLQREDAWAAEVAPERYLERCELKTARLFEAACRLGSMLGRPGPGAADALGTFGRRIGIAFQIFDDVLDLSGCPERTGKARGADLADGTVTLPLILARRRDPGLAGIDLRAEVEDPARVELLCERIAATGALDEARDEALAHVGEAKDALAGLRLPAEQAEALELVADGVVERYA
jgi:geranylgeranyl pyrophosphate synthase